MPFVQVNGTSVISFLLFTIELTRDQAPYRCLICV